MTLTLDEAIARVPFLAESKNLKTTPLSGGITNLNYKIEADGKSYVLRITGADTEKLGIRREVEYAANLAAGRLGVAPDVMYFIEPEGYLLTRFINGKRMPPEVITRPDNIVRVVRKLRLFHRRAPELKGEFNVFRRVEMLTKVSKSNNFYSGGAWEHDNYGVSYVHADHVLGPYSLPTVDQQITCCVLCLVI